MSRYEDNQEILEAFDLQAWLDDRGLRYKMGRGQSGMQINVQECPACKDNRYRTYLNAETGRGNCFVCNETYSKQKFVHLALGHDPDSKHDWGQTFKNIREFAAGQGWRPRKRMEVAVEFEEAKFPTSIELPTEDGRNLQYLENRGLDGELARYFHLRYCEKGYWRFKKEDGEDGWQRFDGRVIIPVFDLDGTFVTYQGRDITGEAGDKKYLFPMGLPGTGRYLLNGHNAKGMPQAVMGEGFFDVAAIKIAFDQEPTLRHVAPIGSFGKHLSAGSLDGNDQLGRLLSLKKEGLKEITIMWDGEVKALESALIAAETIERHGLKARIALLPFERDPNEVVAEVVRQAFRDAKPYSKALHLQWMLRNPYKAQADAKRKLAGS